MSQTQNPDGETLDELEEGDRVKVIDGDHQQRGNVLEITSHPRNDGGDWRTTVKVKEPGTVGPCLPIDPAKVTKDLDREWV